jgi:alkylation response protein AidB-like acyl-CoA dehydrogenase
MPTIEEFKSFFLDEYEAVAREIDETDAIPPAIVDRAAELGCFRLTLPTEYGGLGLSFLEYLPFLEIAAQGPGSGRMLVHQVNGVWRTIHAYGTDAQRALLPQTATGDCFLAFCLTERAGGTGRDLHSRGVRDGDGWRITGEKTLITFADRADQFILMIATDNRHSKDSLTAFIVPRETEGFEIDATQKTMGLHGSGHAWLRYDKMYVPDSARLGDVGAGLDVALSFLDYSRVSLSNCMVGLAQRALDEAVAFAQQRTTFGKAIADRQMIQAHLGTMQADVLAGRCLVRMVAERCQNGEEFTADAAAAKLFCLNMVGRVTDLSLRVHGGYGFTTDAPIERIYRDARGFWFEEGTAEIQQLVVARHLLSA